MAEPDGLPGGEPMRVVAPDAGELERAAEAALRPKRLAEFVGQRVVRGQLQLVLDAARGRGASPDHVLLAGPPGLGKTTLAMIIAAEMGTSLRLTSGPAIQHAGDLAAILSGLQEGDILFIDEIHRLARTAEEMLYLAMEDFRVDVVVGKGPGATSIPLTLPRFTAVGATTRSGLLPAPLRDRFGFTAHLEFYETDELEQVVARSASLLGAPLGEGAAHEIASRSRGTPRIANRLLRRVVDYAQVHGDGAATLGAARGPGPLRGRPPRAGPPRPGGPGGRVQALRGRARGADHPVGDDRRGGGDGRDGRRALPGARGLPGAHQPRADGNPQGVGAPGTGAAGRRGSAFPLRIRHAARRDDYRLDLGVFTH